MKSRILTIVITVCIVQTLNNIFTYEKTTIDQVDIQKFTVEEVDYDEVEEKEQIVYVAPTGKRYHLRKSCAGKNAIETTIEEQKNRTTSCKKCAL